MRIRIATARDLPGIKNLLLQVGQVHHEIRPDIFRAGCLKYDIDDLNVLLSEENRPIFVAVEEDLVMGYCFCIVKNFDGDSVLTNRKEIYIDDLCVDQEHRGQGIASALYRHVLAFAKALDCRFVTLNVWCGNQSAMEFYEKMGLTPRSITMETSL